MSVEVLKDRLAKLSSQGGEIRGITVQPGARWPATRVSGVVFIDCDFRMLQLGGVLSRPTFEECVFQHVNLDGGKWSGVSFRNCRFEDVDVGTAAMSHWSKCHFESCAWSGGRLAATNLDDCRVIDNTFNEVTWEQATLLRCRVRSTRISGQFRTVLFDRCLLEELDLSDVGFRELTFLDSEFKGAFRTPDAADTLILQNESELAEWLDAVGEKLGIEARSQLNEDLSFLRKTGRPICIDPESFEVLPLEQRAAAIAAGSARLGR